MRIRFDDIYTPTPKQRVLHQSTAYELLYGGAAGGGKSHAAVMDAVMVAIQFPGVQLFLFRRTFRELEDTLIKIARENVPRELATYNTTRHEMEFINGSKLMFRHCNRPSDVGSYKGAEMNGLYVDELTDFDESVYNFLKTRVRAGKTLGIKPFIRCFSNPGSIGHAWVKKRFVDPHPEGGTHIETIKSELTGREDHRVVQYIPATVLDNPHLSQQYVYELENKPKNLRDALLLGKWDAFEGQAFPEWMDDETHHGDGLNTHVISPFPIKEHWPHWMSIDWGYAKPFAICWWAVDETTNTVYLYDEWYGSNGVANTGAQMDPELVARGIKRREAEVSRGMQFTRVGDPHIWDEENGQSIGKQFQREGIYIKRGDNTRLAGKMQIHYRLRMAPTGLLDDDGRPIGRPKLQVFNTCRNFIRTFPALAYSQTKPEDVDTDGEDHIYDATRYFLMEFKMSAPTEKPQQAVFTPGKIDPFATPRRAAGGRYVPRG